VAYDLFLRRHIDHDYARGANERSAKSSSLLKGLCFAIAGGAILLPEIAKRHENEREKERLRDDFLTETQRLPAMPDMEEMMAEEGLGRVA